MTDEESLALLTGLSVERIRELGGIRDQSEVDNLSDEDAGVFYYLNGDQDD